MTTITKVVFNSHFGYFVSKILYYHTNYVIIKYCLIYQNVLK